MAPATVQSVRLEDEYTLWAYARSLSHGSVQTFISSLIVEELLKLDLSDFVISPGARAIPFVLALNGMKDRCGAQPRCQIVNDERSAAFFAQGISKSGKVPALICTSGTAVSNYLPGVIEAYYSKCPLLIITCDRPWELQSAGANQTIKQNDIFKDFISLKIEMGPFDKHLGLHSVLSNLASIISKAKESSQPVHLNICFRKPFYDAGFDPELDLTEEDKSVFLSWYRSENAYVESCEGDREIVYSSVNIGVNTNNNGKALFVLGPSKDSNFINLIGRISEEKEIPLFADINSNIRQLKYKTVQSYYNQYLKDVSDTQLPKQVYLFGDRIISDELQKFLSRLSCPIVQVGVGPLRQDAIENEFIKVSRKLDLTFFLNTELNSLARNSSDFSSPYFSLNRSYGQKVEDILGKEDGTERSLIYRILSKAPEKSNIFLAISLIFREAENFCGKLPADSIVYSNRGATGIDGIISSSIGTSINSDSPLLCVVGDQASLHDLTGLSLVHRRKGPTLILIVNNNGGAIFNIMKKPEILDTLVHSHGYNFENFARGFSLEYQQTSSVSEAVSIMTELFKTKNKLVLEVTVDGVESANNLLLP